MLPKKIIDSGVEDLRSQRHGQSRTGRQRGSSIASGFGWAVIKPALGNVVCELVKLLFQLAERPLALLPKFLRPLKLLSAARYEQAAQLA